MDRNLNWTLTKSFRFDLYMEFGMLVSSLVFTFGCSYRYLKLVHIYCASSIMYNRKK